MEEASGETNQTPKENSRDTGEVAGEQVTVGAEVNHDVDKTLYVCIFNLFLSLIVNLEKIPAFRDSTLDSWRKLL